ncbi:MAG TPA: phosphoglycerate kinase [Candidatus Limnocylindrales bacterium]|nr:phosphoglycerate kinase [Candidatus Limnocylindrales bacterium]
MKKTISDLAASSLEGRTVVVRVDFNVPLGPQGVTDDRRIRETIPTLELLTSAGARVVLLSHLGRPDGEAKPKYSLAPVAERLGRLLARPVAFSPSPNGSDAVDTVSGLGEGDVALLENTRYLPGEEDNDPELAGFWAGLGDLFVNDAFGVAHRAHASTAGLAEAMRREGGEAVTGLLMARELRYLQEALERPERPFIGILGGAKISGKIGVISALLGRVDRLLIGGAMANTFFRAQGRETGASLVEEDALELAAELLEEGGERLLLPVDCIVADEVVEGASTRAVPVSGVSVEEKIVDIGPETRALFSGEIVRSRSIIWNGPMGVFEIDAFADGTVEIARAVAQACDAGALGVVGGGDSSAAVERAGVADRVSHVSTGGGASIELLAGGSLPGVDSLTEAG